MRPHAFLSSSDDGLLACCSERPEVSCSFCLPSAVHCLAVVSEDFTARVAETSESWRKEESLFCCSYTLGMYCCSSSEM